MEVGAPIDPELTADAEEGGDVGPLGAGAGTSLHRQSPPARASTGRSAGSAQARPGCTGYAREKLVRTQCVHRVWPTRKDRIDYPLRGPSRAPWRTGGAVSRGPGRGRSARGGVVPRLVHRKVTLGVTPSVTPIIWCNELHPCYTSVTRSVMAESVMKIHYTFITPSLHSV